MRKYGNEKVVIELGIVVCHRFEWVRLSFKFEFTKLRNFKLMIVENYSPDARNVSTLKPKARMK